MDTLGALLQIAKSNHTIPPAMTSFSNFGFPFTDVESMKKFHQTITESTETREKLVSVANNHDCIKTTIKIHQSMDIGYLQIKFLGSIGGRDLKSSVKMMMEKMMADEVLGLFNMKGKGAKNKMSLNEYSMFKCAIYGKN